MGAIVCSWIKLQPLYSLLLNIVYAYWTFKYKMKFFCMEIILPTDIKCFCLATYITYNPLYPLFIFLLIPELLTLLIFAPSSIPRSRAFNHVQILLIVRVLLTLSPNHRNVFFKAVSPAEYLF